MQDLMSQMDQCIADNWCVDNGEVCYDDCAKQTYGGSYTVGLAQVSADVENPLLLWDDDDSLLKIGHNPSRGVSLRLAQISNASSRGKSGRLAQIDNSRTLKPNGMALKPNGRRSKYDLAQIREE